MNINTKILQKRATASYWANHGDFLPDSGELIVYLPDSTNDNVRLKIGDGHNNLSDLRFLDITDYMNSSDREELEGSIDTLRSDVNDALEELRNDIPEVGNQHSLTIGNIIYDGSADKTVTIADLGLSSVLKFAGVTISPLSDKSSLSPVDIKSGDGYIECVPELGDVVVGPENMEYLWDGECWQQLGDPNSFKRKQTPVYNSASSGLSNTNTFVDSIEQDENGVITATTKTVSMPNYASSDSIGGSANSAKSLDHNVTIYLNGGASMPSSTTTKFSYNELTIPIPEIIESKIVYESQNEHSQTVYTPISEKYLEKSAEISTDKLSDGTKILILDCGTSTETID